MNERIRELAEQALQLVADEHANGDESRLNLASYTVKDLIQEKFAELIVGECAKLLPPEMTHGPDGRPLEQVFKQHFGVEQ
jgi:hypothetical protein